MDELVTQRVKKQNLLANTGNKDILQLRKVNDLVNGR